MSDKCKIQKGDEAYFITCTIVEWIKVLEEEKPEGYQHILDKYSKAVKHLMRKKNHIVWQDGNMAKMIYSTKFLLQKLSYIHSNPVEYGLSS